MKNNISNHRSLQRKTIIEPYESLLDQPIKQKNKHKIIPITSISMFINKMSIIRETAYQLQLIPLYHYTSKTAAELILQTGFRMSTQGQGDGGVYFSTFGPASYGLGTSNYELNIIKDCFGVERVNEYLGKGKLDALIVYGCEADILLQAPGGRDNAKMIPKPFFTSLSLPQDDGNYFLRPDKILAVFIIHKNVTLKNNLHINECKLLLKIEKDNSKLLIKNAIESDHCAEKYLIIAKEYSDKSSNKENDENGDESNGNVKIAQTVNIQNVVQTQELVEAKTKPQLVETSSPSCSRNKVNPPNAKNSKKNLKTKKDDLVEIVSVPKSNRLTLPSNVFDGSHGASI